MSQWGKNDASSNAPAWATALVNLPSNTANRDALFGNTTQEAFNNAGVATKKAVGLFGMDATEARVANGSIVSFTITNPGSGYKANAAVTLTGGGASVNATANATSNATGRISALNVNTAGEGYSTKPAVVVAAPAAQTINANTSLFHEVTFNANADVTNATDFIAISSNPFVNGDILQYLVAAGNTALTNLTNASSYYVVSGNSTGIVLAANSSSANIDLTKGLTETGHTLRRTGGNIEIGSNVFQVGDLVTYTVAAGNTKITELANGSSYYVVQSNSTVIKISSDKGGTAISLTPGLSETGHSFTGETATASAVISGVAGKGPHPGWVLRTEGQGGRAGRVTYETLVALRSMTGDASDDTILKDA